MEVQPRAQRFLSHLPAIYQQQPELAVFLRPFEALLLGEGARRLGEAAGLRETILSLPWWISAEDAPEEFLEWLGSWVALALRADLPVDRKRALIARAGMLYQWRGTRKGLILLLALVTGNGTPAIREPEVVTLTVGVQAVIGATTRLGRDLPYFFEVDVVFPGPRLASEDGLALESLVRDTIELGKPAHTYYKLKLVFAETATPMAAAGDAGTHTAGRAESNANAST